MIKIVEGDITEFEGDAVTNAANEGLWAGGGVCGAIFDAAGYRELSEACSRIGHCPTGEARITPGFNLKAKYIIHAVGPMYFNHPDPEGALHKVYQSIIEVARQNGIKTIAVPSISTGIFRFPLDKASKIAVEEMSKANDIEFTVYCFAYDVHLAYEEALKP